MDWVASVLLILESKDVSVAFEDIEHVLFEQAHQSQLEFLVASDCVGVVLDCAVELAVFYVHCFHSITRFFFAKLVVHNFFKTHTLIVEQRDKAVIIASIAHDVVAGLSIVIEVQVVEDHVVWGAHFSLQV